MRKRRILSILTALALCLSLLPATALAVEDVTYLDADGNTASCNSATVVTTSTKEWTGTLSDGAWYVVNSDIIIADRITVTGDVHLILADGCTLTAQQGISVISGNSLTIYGQSEGDGALTAGTAGVADDYDAPTAFYAGIGGVKGNDGVYAHGNITINGGNITAYGGIAAAGIGGGTGLSSKTEINGNITINGGTVNAIGGNQAAGIGCGSQNGVAGGNITITGGTVTAWGGADGAGIGGGKSNDYTPGRSITISGGTVNATGGDRAAGIGSGSDSRVNRSIGTIKINGSANVTAKGGLGAAGIGSSYEGTITGAIQIGGSATVDATGGDSDGAILAAGAGIGSGGNGGKVGNITITGGTVTATGGEGKELASSSGSSRFSGAGIGSGGGLSNASTSNPIIINAGTITANGGTGAAGIGSGSGESTSGDFSTDRTVNDKPVAGKAVIYTDSITDDEDTSDWNGIVFLGNEGTVYGEVSLNRNLNVKKNQTLTVPENATLTLAEGKKLTVQQKGKLIVEEGGALDNLGTITNNGTATIKGTFDGEPITGGGTTTMPPSYGISLVPDIDKNFGSAEVGYAAITPYEVTVTNTGNQSTGELTIALSGNNASSFQLSGGTLFSIAVDSNATFTVAPVTGLGAGTYTAVVTVSGGNNISKSFTVSFTVTAPAPVTYTITATAGEGGSITPSDSVSVTAGDDKTFTITPSAGYEIDDVLVDNDSVKGSLSNNTYTFNNVQNNHNISVTFKETSTITPEPAYVATLTVNGVTTSYETVEDAIDEANSQGGKVTLLDNATLTGGETDSQGLTYTRILKDITLDLGGYTLEYGGNAGFAVNPDVTFTIQNGTYRNTAEEGYGILATKSDYDGPGCTIIIADDAVIEAYDGIVTVGHTKLEVYGKIHATENAIFGSGPQNEVLVENAELTSKKYGIYQQHKDGGSSYTIKNSEITVTGENGYAVCICNEEENIAPTNQGMQKLEIENSTITGYFGIYVEYTDVTVFGDETEVNAAKGYALAVYHRDGEETLGTLSIEDGSFVGEVYIQPDEENDTATATLTISGGNFTDDVREYVVDSMTQDKEGNIVEKVPANNITLDASNLNLYVGDKKTLTATVEPGDATEQTVTWESDNPDVATVDSDGTVTAVGVGTATITAKAGEKEASCEVTVNEIPHQHTYDKDAWAFNAAGHWQQCTDPACPDLEGSKKENAEHSYDDEMDTTCNVCGYVRMVTPPEPETYTVTILNGGFGAEGADSYREGDRVYLYAGRRADYEFAGWWSSDVTLEDADSVYTSFIMPDYPVVVEALWYKEDHTPSVTLPTHDITVDSGSHGDVEVWPEEAKMTTTVTVTAMPDKGYEVDEVFVTDKNGKEITVTDKGDGKYTFRMPNDDVTVEVTFRPISDSSSADPGLTITAPSGWINPFTDVAVTAWYYDAVGYASANGLMGGTSATTFAPESPMNRSMVWTVIARLAGQTITGTTWAEDAKAWAVAQGVSDGTNPDGSVTREELVTMLYRYAGSPEMGVAELGLLGRYPDAASVSDWAQSAFAWALSTGIIDGRDGKLAAGDSVTRAEAATILARFHMLTK